MLFGSFFVTVKILLPRPGGRTDEEHAASSTVLTTAFGAKVTLCAEVDCDRGFAVRGVELVPGERMTSCRLTPRPCGTVRFDICEAYTDLSAGMIFKSMPDLQSSFMRFADGLRQRVEGSP